MSFCVSFEDESIGKLAPPYIESFSFVSSIYKMYSGAKLVIKDMSKTLSNKLKTGLKVEVSLFEREKDEKCSNNMAVFSFSKSGSGQMVDTIEVTLISAMFFENTINSLARSGNVGQIVYDILSTEFKGSAPNLDISPTDDRARRRYQLSEKAQDFLKRIVKYGIKDNMPIYLYSAPDGYVHLKGLYEMISDTPTVALSTVLSSQETLTTENGNTLKEKIITGYVLNAFGKNAVSTIDNIFCVDNFSFSSDLDNHLESDSIEKGNSQVAVESPKKVRFLNWNYTPDDAKAIAAKEFFDETSDTFTLDCTLTGFQVKDIFLGSAVYMILPYEPTANSATGNKINLGEGIYLITQIKLLYSDKKETMALSLYQIAS